MAARFFFDSPRQRRLKTVAEETDCIITGIKAANAAMIATFRAALPPHRLGWFDTLSPQDQFRVARPIRTRGDTR